MHVYRYTCIHPHNTYMSIKSTQPGEIERQKKSLLAKGFLDDEASDSNSLDFISRPKSKDRESLKLFSHPKDE